MVQDTTKEPNASDYEAMKAELEELRKKQKLSTSEGQKLNHMVKVLEDPKHFFKVYETNRNFAEDIAKRYDFDTAEAMKEYLEGQDTTINEDTIVEKVIAKQREQEVKQTLDEFFSSKSIDKESDFGKDVIAEYEDLAEGKSLTPQKAKKYLKLAFKEAKGVSEFAEEYEKTLQEAQVSGSKWVKWSWAKPFKRPQLPRGQISLKDIYKKK